MTGRTHLVERAVEALHARPWQPSMRAAIDPGPGAAPQPQLQPSSSTPTSIPVVVGMDALERAGLVPRPEAGQRSRLAEELALVRQQVLRGMPAQTPGDARCARVVMVTSARPAEGKTFTALNLAAAIAEGVDTPVLLVDMDGRSGSLADRLGLPPGPGLRTLVEGNCLPIALPRGTAQPRLSIVPGGTDAPNAAPPPAEALASALRRLAAAFPDHVIVLDMPPALATADAGALAPVVGQIVMVVRAQATRRNEVEAALDVIEACPEIRLLLNRTGLRGKDSFGAQGGYDGHGNPPAP